ncbi:hypothetical protein GCM10011579_014340 [Streptomyces albiflavescens]|uniref:Uncharacterized protein n=1 Tax=Streptomyces albiflavescens TaxID=1623582 RepID=A0A918D0S0_9ACTN|nr:hypothetical protein GCM10011579_014340 [Streptomyces albiflavescens]
MREKQIEGGAVVHGAQDARSARRTGGSCHVVDTCLSTAHLPSDLGGKSIPLITVRKVSYWVEGT